MHTYLPTYIRRYVYTYSSVRVACWRAHLGNAKNAEKLGPIHCGHDAFEFREGHRRAMLVALLVIGLHLARHSCLELQHVGSISSGLGGRAAAEQHNVVHLAQVGFSKAGAFVLVLQAVAFLYW